MDKPTELFPVASVTHFSPAYFDEIAARCEAASPGPWIHETGKFTGQNWLLATVSFGNSQEDGEDHNIYITTDHVHASEMYGDAKADAEFIEHARADIPNLLRVVREQAAEIARMREKT